MVEERERRDRREIHGRECLSLTESLVRMKSSMLTWSDAESAGLSSFFARAMMMGERIDRTNSFGVCSDWEPFRCRGAVMVEESEGDAPRVNGERRRYKESESPFRGPGASDQANAASPGPAHPNNCLPSKPVRTPSFTPRLLVREWFTAWASLVIDGSLINYKKAKHGLIPRGWAQEYDHRRPLTGHNALKQCQSAPGAGWSC